MSAKFDRIVKKISNSVKASQEKKTSAYDTTAKVLRVDGDIAWVHIPGGVDETPVRLTVNAEAGDDVQVRVSGGDAWLVGNGTAPPTDDRVANIANGKATTADKKATTAKKSADEALDGVKKQREFFWHDDDGAHVLSDADGTTGTRYRTDVKGAGLEIFKVNQDGTEESVASFGGDGARLGKTGSAHVKTTATDIEFFDDDGNSRFYIGKPSSADGLTPVRDIIAFNPASPIYSLSHTIDVDSGITVKTRAGASVSVAEILDTHRVALNAVSTDAYIFDYKTPDEMYTYWLGVNEQSIYGAESVSESIGSAYGDYSHAEGDSVAGGKYSHASGKGNIALGEAQFVAGQYNDPSYYEKRSGGLLGYLPYLFILGNGSSDSNRSNAFTVDWNGNVEASGGFTSPTLTQSFTSQYADAVYVEKWGKIVSVTLINMKALPNGQMITLFTLPSGWRPSHNCMWLLRNPTDTYMLRIIITSGGLVQVYNYGSSALPASSNATQTCTFITA